MGTYRWLRRFVRIAAAAALLLVIAGLLPSSVTANQHRKIVGKYFLADSFVNVYGGAELYDDCTHDGGLIAAPPFGPPATYRLVPTTWVNNPDPTIAPYNVWAVPPALQGQDLLFLCYDVKPIAGTPPPFPTFCDWAPRDHKGPLEIFNPATGERDMLIDVEFKRGPNLCAAPAQ